MLRSPPRPWTPHPTSCAAPCAPPQRHPGVTGTGGNYRRPDRTLCRAVDGVWRCAHGKTWARVALLSFVTLFFCVVYPSTERGHADSSVALLMRHTDNNKLARVPSGRQLPRVSMWRKTCSLSLSYLSNSVLTHCRWSRRELGISREGGVEHAHDRRTVTNECVLLCS